MSAQLIVKPVVWGGKKTRAIITHTERGKILKPIKRKRKKPFAANNASKKALEADGWSVDVVEKTIPHCFIKKDCFGFGDLLAISPTRKSILMVQATGGGNLSSRAKKIRQTPNAALWLASGGRIQVHDWRKRADVKDRECVVLEITKENY